MADIDAPLPSQPLSTRLGQWIDWRHAVALSAALDTRPSTSPIADSQPGPTPDDDYARVRALLVKAIEEDRAFCRADGPAPDCTFFRQRYVALQQVMEAEASHLRARIRGALARQRPSLQPLAATDAVMERTLGRHERALLSALPELLGRHFDRLCQAGRGAWLERFLQDMQRLLLAELELRLQPAEGLRAALRNTPHG